jgi:hypothetical protein
MRATSRRLPSLLFATLLAAPACSRTTGESDAGATPAPATSEANASSAVLAVDNRSSDDFDVWFVNQGQRSRIGTAPAGEKTRFELSRAQIVGAGFAHFEATPTSAAAGRPVASETMSVNPGDEVAFDIPPQ